MKKQITLIVITALASAALTRYYFPKTVTKIEEKEVVRKDVKTIIKEVVKKDGTKETTTEILDRSTEKREFMLEQFKISDWIVSASYGMKEFKGEPIYGLQVQRRILGPLFLGLTGSTDKVYGISVGMEF